jgi:hypothetical protein
MDSLSNLSKSSEFRPCICTTDKVSLVQPKGGTSLTSVGHHLTDAARKLLFYPCGYFFLSVSLSLVPTGAIHHLSPLKNHLSLSKEIWGFNQGKATRLEEKDSHKTPLLVPLRVLWIPFKFLSQKVFKYSFQPISLLLVKIWISFGI